MEISIPTTVSTEVYLNPDLCRNCGLCIDMCSMGVFANTDEGVYPLKSHLCIACFKCNDFCPENAITTRFVVRA